VAQWFDRIVAVAEGEYLLPIPPYATLPRHAFLEFATAIASSAGAALIYSDEDALDDAGLRMAPRFKPEWDPEIMLGRDVVGHLSAYRIALLRDVGSTSPALQSSEAFLYDLTLRIAAMPDAAMVRHIPEVLCSVPWDMLQAGAMDGLTARQIVAAHLDRLGIEGASVVANPRAAAWSRVIWPVPSPQPLVSVIVPTRDQPTMLSRCVEGVLTRTDYPNLELRIVDNGSVDQEALSLMRDLQADSRVHVLRVDAPFNFSTLNNYAARHARGSVLVLLNDDTEVIDKGWLRELVSHAIRPEIGMVGARLLYPTDQIQHAGVVLSAGGAHHQFRLCDPSEMGPNGELALTRSVSAVTAACVAIRKSVLEEVGGLDDEFAVAFGDVDLCLRIASLGYRLICTPFATLYHHESASRGYEDTPAKRSRFASELALLRRRWASELRVDRYASPRLLFAWDDEGTWGLPRPPGYLGPGSDMPLASGPSLEARFRRSYLYARAIAARVLPNPLFSSDFYRAHYPEARSYRLGPYQHYRRRGVAEEYDPNAFFSTRWYLRRYPDVAASGMNPLDHYLRSGASEGRDPSPSFSTRGYLSEYPDVRAGGHNPLLHFLRHGESEGRRPKPGPRRDSAAPAAGPDKSVIDLHERPEAARRE
jgi:GT2 family glycosyltransferase